MRAHTAYFESALDFASHTAGAVVPLKLSNNPNETCASMEDSMTWSPHEALRQRQSAFRFLLNKEDQFTRYIDWQSKVDTNVPMGVWTRLCKEELIIMNVVGSDHLPELLKFRLTIPGWIAACQSLRDEIDLDARFGRLFRYLKSLVNRSVSEVETTTDAIANATDLPEAWVSDAIEGDMAGVIFRRCGAKLLRGTVEVPAHMGNLL